MFILECYEFNADHEGFFVAKFLPISKDGRIYMSGTVDVQVPSDIYFEVGKHYDCSLKLILN